MKNTAQTIALLERKRSEVKSNKEKAQITKAIQGLREKLTAEQHKSLPAERKKVDKLSTGSFADFIKELKARPEYAFLKGMSMGKILDDVRVVGKPVGWRMKGRGDYRVPSKRYRRDHPEDVYFEDRANRSDVIRRNRLEFGGKLPSHDVTANKAALGRVSAMSDQEVIEELREFAEHLSGQRSRSAERIKSVLGQGLKEQRSALVKLYEQDFEDVEEHSFANGGAIGAEDDVDLIKAESVDGKETNANFLWPRHRKATTIGVRLERGGTMPSEDEVDAAIKRFESNGYEVNMRIFGGWRVEKGDKSMKLSDAQIVAESKLL